MACDAYPQEGVARAASNSACMLDCVTGLGRSQTAVRTGSRTGSPPRPSIQQPLEPCCQVTVRSRCQQTLVPVPAVSLQSERGASSAVNSVHGHGPMIIQLNDSDGNFTSRGACLALKAASHACSAGLILSVSRLAQHRIRAALHSRGRRA